MALMGKRGSMKSRWDEIGIPNPGSHEARDQGCVCSVHDNHHGQGIQLNNELIYWVHDKCPVHVIVVESLRV